MKLSAYFSLIFLFFFTACAEEKTIDSSPWKRTSNEVIIRQEASPTKLNPVLSTTVYEREVTNQIFSILVNNHPQTFDFIPELIKTLPAIEQLKNGGEALHFEIHENAVWDDGKPVTGYDFVFTVKSILIPTVPTRLRTYIALISAIQVDKNHPRKFTVFTREKNPASLEWIANSTYVLPKHIYDPKGLLDHISNRDFFDKKTLAKLEEEDDKIIEFRKDFISAKYNKNPAFISGCGPYKLVKWEEGKEIILEKKENWWGDKYARNYKPLLAYPDRLIFKPIMDNVTTVAALQSEEIDVASNIDSKTFLQLQKDEKLSKIYDFEMPPYYAYYLLALNTRRPKLADKRVRQAIAYTLDLDQIIDVVYGGIATPLTAPVHPSSDMYNHKLVPYTYNIEKAKQLLKAAGWEDSNNDGIVDKEIEGESVELVLDYQYPNKSSRSKNIGVLFEETAKKVGIKIILKPLDYKIQVRNTQAGNYDIATKGRGWPPKSWNPKQNWHTTSNGITGFGDEKTDALLDNIIAEFDSTKKIEMIKEFQAIVHEECPEIYLVTPNSRIIVHKRFAWEASPALPGYSPNTFKLKTSDEK